MIGNNSIWVLFLLAVKTFASSSNVDAVYVQNYNEMQRVKYKTAHVKKLYGNAANGWDTYVKRFAALWASDVPPDIHRWLRPPDRLAAAVNDCST